MQVLVVTSQFLLQMHKMFNQDGRFGPEMLRIVRIGVFGVFTISSFVKNREFRPDKNKFTFVLGILTMELDEVP